MQKKNIERFHTKFELSMSMEELVVGKIEWSPLSPWRSMYIC